MESKKPLIAVLVAAAFAGGIYLFANRVPPPPKAKEGPMAAGGAMGQKPAAPELNVDSFENAVKRGLPQHALAEFQQIERSLQSAKDSAAMQPLYEQIASLYKEHRQPALAGYYYYRSSKLANSEKSLTFAAQLLLDLARKEHGEALQHWEAGNAIDAFEQVLRINPANDSARISLAECYFGTGEAMKGVVLLKEITGKDPENKAANLLLGQQGLVSGQYDKARQRFETVLKNDPKNLEAMLGLAEALKGLGEKEKAIALLESCKKLIKNPDFAKDIDEYIKTFK
jgi:predicted Zn-dependent protease